MHLFTSSTPLSLVLLVFAVQAYANPILDVCTELPL